MLETDLYPPVKAYLEGQGYEVKAEIGHCDLMARRGLEPVIVVELKRSFSLSLVLQGIDRQRSFDHVYLAVPKPGEKGWPQRYKDIRHLCRRLGLGLLVVDTKDTQRVEAHFDPASYQARTNKQRQGRLLREFERRIGDPNVGGSTRVKRMTAYRQDALRCASHLKRNGASKARDVKAATGVVKATAIMSADHYGWFERIERGVYAITPNGVEGLAEYADMLAAIEG